MARTEQEIFDELGALCVSPGYVHAIASFCFRDNAVGFGDELTVKDLIGSYSRSRLIRTEISTLIGLLVRRAIDYSLPAPETLSAYMERTEKLLDELHHSMSGVWFEGVDLHNPLPEGFDPFSSGKSLREPIFYSGESAYSFQYRDLAPQKYVHDNAWLQANRGFSVQTARATINAIVQIQNEKLTNLLNTLRSLPQSEWTTLPGYTFCADEVAERAALRIEDVAPVLTAFALPLDDANEAFTGLQEMNLINASPLIPFGDRTYLLFQYFSLVEAFYESPFYWMGADRAYTQTAMRNRGKFTESFAKERLEAVFGKGRVFGNVDIVKNRSEKISEIDVLVLFGDRAIIVQTKSKRLTMLARKGNDLQIKDDFKKAVQDAYDQAHECARELLLGNAAFVAEGQLIPISQPKMVYPLCLVSDHYPALNFQAQKFLKQEQSDGIRPPLVTDIFALDAMAEMLNAPLHFLNYLDLRTRISHRLHATHEFTFLSEHLKRNLWISDEYDFVYFDDDVGVDLDLAMTVRREGIPGKRTPDGILTRYKGTPLARLVEQIEEKPAPATTDLGLLLLQINENTCDALNKGIETIMSQTRKDGRVHDVTVGISGADCGLTIHCIRGGPDGFSAARLQGHCERRKYSQKVDCWFGLILSPEDGSILLGIRLDYPWVHDDHLDAVVSNMSPAQPVTVLKAPFTQKEKAGRNDPCPCGSGRKYKKCCLQ